MWHTCRHFIWPIKIRSSQLKSGSARWDPEITVEVRQCPPRCKVGCWGKEESGSREGVHHLEALTWQMGQKIWQIPCCWDHSHWYTCDSNGVHWSSLFLRVSDCRRHASHQVPRFQGSASVSKQKMVHHSPTQRLKPNNHCCWEFLFVDTVWGKLQETIVFYDQITINVWIPCGASHYSIQRKFERATYVAVIHLVRTFVHIFVPTMI